MMRKSAALLAAFGVLKITSVDAQAPTCGAASATCGPFIAEVRQPHHSHRQHCLPRAGAPDPLGSGSGGDLACSPGSQRAPPPPANHATVTQAAEGSSSNKYIVRLPPTASPTTFV